MSAQSHWGCRTERARSGEASAAGTWDHHSGLPCTPGRTHTLCTPQVHHRGHQGIFYLPPTHPGKYRWASLCSWCLVWTGISLFSPSFCLSLPNFSPFHILIPLYITEFTTSPAIPYRFHQLGSSSFNGRDSAVSRELQTGTTESWSGTLL